MIDLYKKHQKMILRLAGGMMLLVGFAIHFWNTPKEGFTKDELAAANVARMEASVSSKSAASTQSEKPKHAPLFHELRDAQKKQFEYLTIIVMLFGGGFLAYSFVKKD